ncbi:MAG: pyruvate kinase alpha/beta domain-containing protein, partial [Stellaceae bacterium]
VEAVKMMDRIIRRVQADPAYFPSLHHSAATSDHTPSDAISAAAGMVAHTIGAAAIMSYTTSGATGLRAARERPDVPVIALTSNLSTARRLAIAWGLHCVHTADVSNFTDMVQKATQTARDEGFAQMGQRIVITAGVPFGTPGATNVLRIAWVDA